MLISEMKMKSMKPRNPFNTAGDNPDHNFEILS